MKVVCRLGSREIELDDGGLAPYQAKLKALGSVPPARLVYAAAHVVMLDTYADISHTLEAAVPTAEISPHIDWEGTLALRKRLDQLGFGIAEAMDTAQRFFIGWDNALRLIETTGAARLAHGFIAGAGVDHLEVVRSEDELVAGVIYQARAIQAAGGYAILLPLVWLTQNGCSEEDYLSIYGRIFAGLEGPLFVHWLGEMFMPALKGYFPGQSFERIMALDASKVRGAKLSLLDADLERSLRADLATRGQIMLTGDDFHFGALMAGPPTEHTVRIGDQTVPLGDFSHGLLGIFDGIAAPASVALGFLAHGDEATYRELMNPCEALGKHLFQAPTQHYKAGLAFLSWLNGAQPNPMLVRHEQRARDLNHYIEAARLASLAGALENAELAAERLQDYAQV
ncbi:MAG: hypothetical protein ACI9X4_001629 [Glaciecola sp.]|jgi:hypothetical protein